MPLPRAPSQPAMSVLNEQMRDQEEAFPEDDEGNQALSLQRGELLADAPSASFNAGMAEAAEEASEHGLQMAEAEAIYGMTDAAEVAARGLQMAAAAAAAAAEAAYAWQDSSSLGGGSEFNSEPSRSAPFNLLTGKHPYEEEGADIADSSSPGQYGNEIHSGCLRQQHSPPATHLCYREEPDFDALLSQYPVLKKFETTSKDGRHHLDCSSREGNLALSATLLRHDLGIDWSVPEDHLVPQLAHRACYVHWLNDLLTLSSPQGIDPPRGLDIGCGASYIFCLLGAAMYGWRMVGADVTDVALEWSQRHVQANGQLAHLLSVRDSRAEDVDRDGRRSKKVELSQRGPHSDAAPLAPQPDPKQAATSPCCHLTRVPAANAATSPCRQLSSVPAHQQVADVGGILMAAIQGRVLSCTSSCTLTAGASPGAVAPSLEVVVAAAQVGAAPHDRAAAVGASVKLRKVHLDGDNDNDDTLNNNASLDSGLVADDVLGEEAVHPKAIGWNHLPPLNPEELLDVAAADDEDANDVNDHVDDDGEVVSRSCQEAVAVATSAAGAVALRPVHSDAQSSHEGCHDRSTCEASLREANPVACAQGCVCDQHPAGCDLSSPPSTQMQPAISIQEEPVYRPTSSTQLQPAAASHPDSARFCQIHPDPPSFSQIQPATASHPEARCHQPRGTLLPAPSADEVQESDARNVSVPEVFSFTMCHPPPFDSPEECSQQRGAALGGTPEELLYPGGELAFIMRMVEDSVRLGARVHWYSAMVGKKSTLKQLRRELHKRHVTAIRTTEFGALGGSSCTWQQQQQHRAAAAAAKGSSSSSEPPAAVRWAIAWSFEVDSNLANQPLPRIATASSSPSSQEADLPKRHISFSVHGSKSDGPKLLHLLELILTEQGAMHHCIDRGALSMAVILPWGEQGVGLAPPVVHPSVASCTTVKRQRGASLERVKPSCSATSAAAGYDPGMDVVPGVLLRVQVERVQRGTFQVSGSTPKNSCEAEVLAFSRVMTKIEADVMSRWQ